MGVQLWLSHPAAPNLASAHLSKHNATAGYNMSTVSLSCRWLLDKSKSPWFFYAVFFCLWNSVGSVFVDLSTLFHVIGFQRMHQNNPCRRAKTIFWLLSGRLLQFYMDKPIKKASIRINWLVKRPHLFTRMAKPSNIHLFTPGPLSPVKGMEEGEGWKMCSNARNGGVWRQKEWSGGE